jgi:MFS family permease
VPAESVGIRDIAGDRRVRAITGLALLVMTGFGLVLPVLPLYARSFGVGYGAASLMISAWALTRLGSDLVAGTLVDRHGERRVGAAAVSLTAVCALGAGLAPTFPLAVAFWAAGGAGSAAMFAAFYSYLLKSVSRERMARTLALFYGAFNVGMIAGGPIGGAIASRFGLAAPLLVYAGTLAAAAVAYRFLPEPGSARIEPALSPAEAERERDLPVARGGRATLARLARTPAFPTVMLLNLAYMWAVAAVLDTLVPFFARDGLGVSTAGVGALFAVLLVAELAVLYPAGSAADRLGRKAVLVPSLAGLAVTTVLVGFAPTIALLVLALAALGICSGYAGVPPAAMLSDVTPPEASGSAIGAFRFFGDVGFLVGPAVAGFAASALGFEAAFAIAAIPTVVALVAVTRTRETLAPRAPAEHAASIAR